MTRPGPHASYREHVSSKAEAVEEEVVERPPFATSLDEVLWLRSENAILRENKYRLVAENMDLQRKLANRDAALNSGEQKQTEDWPYPEGNPTCAQDLK